MTVWMAVTSDELELPLAAGETARELGTYIGIKPEYIHQALSKGLNDKNWGFKIVKVNVE